MIPGFYIDWGESMKRRIILLSDGTGNSSASFWRTNVWRMFTALDLSSSEQVACYDDGVGTSSFKPLAILGGAFGVGLRLRSTSLRAAIFGTMAIKFTPSDSVAAHLRSAL
jgi:uncharacterized protein (DUF2235 family)